MFSSCSEDVITVDLKKVAPRIVIDGTITDQEEPCTVKITKTVDYFKPGEYPAVSGAVVTVSDDAGNFDTLEETDQGVYQTTKVKGAEGRTYTLKVIAEDQEYIAISTMPQAAEIDSVKCEFETHYGEKESVIYCYFRDRIGIEDLYRFRIYKNGIIDNSSYQLYNDRLSDGKAFEYEFFEYTDFTVGDTLTVELRTIDRATYDYFLTMFDALATYEEGNYIFTSVPGNPVSNINNGALGCFSAYTRRFKTIVLQE
ncbi:MAG: DUF4249 domain-containing protein [Candidatus Latescibacteria bacterium]|nr:DUF4249 domain-containing protein [Candidatus Latescibacterota bacterium]